MQNYEIRNREVLDILEQFRYNYTEKYQIPEICEMVGDPSNKEYYTSDEFRDKIIRMGREHEGGAGSGYSYFLKPTHLKQPNVEYGRDWTDLDERMKTILGLDISALSQMYPPSGHIEWHNNANAADHNLIFTWSQTGDGFFRYYDLKTKKNVTMPDKKGWTLKAGYFGSYEEPDKVMYHCASTECWRITLSYVLGKNYDYWKDCIDFITEE